MDRAACEYCGEETDFAEFCGDVRRNIKDITGKDADAPMVSSPIPCKVCTHAGVKPYLTFPYKLHLYCATLLSNALSLVALRQGVSISVSAQSFVHFLYTAT